MLKTRVCPELVKTSKSKLIQKYSKCSKKLNPEKIVNFFKFRTMALRLSKGPQESLNPGVLYYELLCFYHWFPVENYLIRVGNRHTKSDKNAFPPDKDYGHPNPSKVISPIKAAQSRKQREVVNFFSTNSHALNV